MINTGIHQIVGKITMKDSRTIPPWEKEEPINPQVEKQSTIHPIPFKGAID